MIDRLPFNLPLCKSARLARPSMPSDYGVKYTPAVNIPTRLSNVSFAALRSTVQYIRLTWVDFVNNTRHRVIPYDYFTKMLSTQRPGVHLPIITLGIVGITAAEGFNGSGEYLYVPDMNTLRMCPYESGTASVLGWFEERDPGPGKSLSAPLCPRSTLRRVVEYVWSTHSPLLSVLFHY